MKTFRNFIIVVLVIFVSITSCVNHLEEEPKDLVYEGNAHFSSININRFSEIISNLRGKEVINGNIYVGLYFNDMNVFKTIKKVTGNVIFDGVSQIESFSFLSNLEEIGGNLEIYNLKNLKSLNGLGKVPKVKSLYLYNNNSTLNINAIKDIEVTNDLKIVGLKEYKIPKFQNISHLKESLSIWDNLAISDIGFLPNLEKVDLDIYIAKNSITSLEGLNKLKSVGRNFNISHNPDLKNLNGLNNLETVYGKLLIVNNLKLKDIKGLSLLKTAKVAIAIDDTQCKNLNGLGNLVETDWLAVLRNPNLSDFCAIKPLIIKNDSVKIRISENYANPTIEEIKLNCP